MTKSKMTNTAALKRNWHPNHGPSPVIVFCALILFCNLCFGICNYCLAQEPSKQEETLFLAKKAFEDGFYDVSLGLLERFLKGYPDSLKIQEANLLIGQCYFHQNRFLDALKKFEGLANQPSAKNIQDAAFYWIAEVHFRGNNFTKAAQYYRKITEQFPGSAYSASAHYSLGWCLFQEERFSEALVYFRLVEKNFPKEPIIQDAAFKIIECLYNMKDYPGLKERLGYYLKSYPQDATRLPYVYFYMGEANYYLNNFEGALEQYSQASSSTRDNKIQALSKLGMGWVYLKMKQYPQAQSKFAEISPENLENSAREILSLGEAALLFETKNVLAAKNIYSELSKTATDPAVLLQASLGEADSYYNLGEYAKAIAAYRQGLDNARGSPGPQEIIDKFHYGLAWAFLKEGRFKEAIEEFQKVVQHTEDKIVKVAALCQIGDAYQDSGDYVGASQAYDNIIKNYPDSFYSDYVQYQLGITLLKLSNYDGALIAFQTLKKQFPNSKLLDDAAYALGLTYFQRQDYNASREIFERFIQDFKENSLLNQAMYLLGSSLYNLGKYNEAIEAFKNIIRSYPRDTDLVQKAEYEIADCYYQTGNEKEAMERFRALRAKYPDSALSAEVVWWLAEYYYRHNDLKEARRYLSALIKDFPDTNLMPHAYYALGSIGQQEGAYEEAIANFKKVRELAKTDLSGTADAAIADIYVKQNRLDEALKTYREVAAKHANLAHLAYPKIAEVYQKLGNYDDAVNFYRKGLDVVPVRETSNIQFKIAEALQAGGKNTEAIEEYLKVTYLYSENGTLAVKALLRVASIYENRDKVKEALNIYNKIVSLKVDESKYAQERIDWIQTQPKTVKQGR